LMAAQAGLLPTPPPPAQIISGPSLWLDEKRRSRQLRLPDFGQNKAAFDFRKLTCKHPRASPPIKLATEKNTGKNSARLKMRPNLYMYCFLSGAVRV
jgi:hypothetical protein